MAKAKVSKTERHIVAIGGGFTAPEVLQYVVSLTGKKQPKILIINTATGDNPANLLMMHEKLADIDCKVTVLRFFARTPQDLEKLVFEQDAVFVGGGNTKSMLAVWREYGLDKILKRAWKRGIVMSGSSAGGICWFDGCCTDSWDVEYTGLPALGFLSGSCCPHYDGEVGRPATFHKLIENGDLTEGIAIDEGVGVHYVGKDIVEVVSAKPKTGAYEVKRVDGKLVDTPLKVRMLK